MDASVQLGLLLAVACALTSILGFLWKFEGAQASPPVEWRRPVSTSLALFRAPRYVLGIAVAFGSWGFHVAALALAPISVVQATIAGGLVFLTVLADRVFGLTVTKREWIAVAVAAIGLATLAATLDGAADKDHEDWTAAGLAAYAGGLTLIGFILIPIARTRRHPGVVLAASTGAVWGASDVCIKALSKHTDEGILVVLHPLSLVILVLSLVGLTISARSLQDGEAVPVIATTSAVANVVTIAAGPIVFAEPFPSDPGAVALRVVAFALVVGAAAALPGPVRVAEREQPAPA